jgi:hypothetical protein
VRRAFHRECYCHEVGGRLSVHYTPTKSLIGNDCTLGVAQLPSKHHPSLREIVSWSLLQLEYAHFGISEAENVRDIDRQEATWSDNRKMETDDRFQQIFPIFKSEIGFVVFANKVWRRPNTQGDTIGFDLGKRVRASPW